MSGMTDMEWLEKLERDFARDSTDARPQTYNKLLALARRALEQPPVSPSVDETDAWVTAVFDGELDGLRIRESAQGGWVAVKAYIERTRYNCESLHHVPWTTAEVMEMIGQIEGLLPPPPSDPSKGGGT